MHLKIPVKEVLKEELLQMHKGATEVKDLQSTLSDTERLE